MSNIQHRQHKHNSTKQNYKRKEKEHYKTKKLNLLPTLIVST